MHRISAFNDAIGRADLLVHFGAGKCRELPDYLSGRNGKDTVLVEAHPELVKMLRARVDAISNVSVMEVAVAGKPGECELHVYNLVDFTSLRSAEYLHELFPGLRLKEKLPVVATSATDLLSQLNSEGRNSICLVIDTPGEEYAILEALAQSRQLDKVADLVVYCSKTALYEAGHGETELRELLDRVGYEVAASEADQDPEFLVLVLKRNRRKLEYERMQKRLSVLGNGLQALRQEFSTEIGELRAAISSKDAEIQALIDARNQQEHDSVRHQQKAAQEKERVRKLKEQRDQLQKRLETVRERLADLRYPEFGAGAGSQDDLELLANLKKAVNFECERSAQLQEERNRLAAELEQLKAQHVISLTDAERRGAHFEEERAALRAEREQLKAQHAEAMEAAAREKSDEIEQLKEQHAAAMEAATKKKDNELDSLQHQCNEWSEVAQQQAREIAEADKRIAELEAELAHLKDKWPSQHESYQVLKNAHAEELEAVRNEFGSEVKRLAEQNGELVNELAALRSGLEVASTERDSLQLERERLADENRKLTEAAAAKEDAVKNARRDLGVALRLQSLREADLKELQERYARIYETKKGQEELLLKLQQRLSVAAEQLKHLALDEQHSGDPLARELLRALGGDDQHRSAK